jgi:hypothetical protein
MSRKSIVTALVVCLVALTAAVVQATPISLYLENPSFESPVISSGGTTMITTSGTTQNGWLGVWIHAGINPFAINGNNNTWGYPAPVDGNNILALRNQSDETIGQTISQTLKTDSTTAFHAAAADVGGTLTVSVYGAWKGATGSGTFALGVWRDADPRTGTPLASASGAVNTKTWAQTTCTYVITSADVGHDLWLSVRDTDLQVDDLNNLIFDKVAATFTPTPEPSTLALLAAGLVGLLCYAWRKRK